VIHFLVYVAGQNDENDMGSSGEPVQPLLLFLQPPNGDNAHCMARAGEIIESGNK
jgi:hypothetical protein